MYFHFHFLEFNFFLLIKYTPTPNPQLLSFSEPYSKQHLSSLFTKITKGLNVSPIYSATIEVGPTTFNFMLKNYHFSYFYKKNNHFIYKIN